MRDKLKNYALIATIFIVSAITSQAIAQEQVNSDWVAPKEADQIANPLKGNNVATKAGKKLFQKQCVVCHGVSGKGDELDAVQAYNDAIKMAREVGDQGTADLLTKILKMEEGHVDWAEIQRAQIEQMGLENYLVSQT